MGYKYIRINEMIIKIVIIKNSEKIAGQIGRLSMSYKSPYVLIAELDKLNGPVSLITNLNQVSSLGTKTNLIGNCPVIYSDFLTHEFPKSKEVYYKHHITSKAK